MRADLMHVVTCVANPLRWETRLRHAKAFIEHMLDSGVNLTVVECAYGDRPHELAGNDHIRHIPVRANTLAWNKESLLNIGIRALPHDAKYVSWIDADVEFRRKDWAAEAVHALQLQPIIQPWSEALDLGPRGEVMTVKGKQVQTSFGSVWRQLEDVLFGGGPYNTYSHPGYSWSATMQFLNDVGLLLDISGAGAGDHQMALGAVGKVDNAIHGLSTESYKAQVRAWGDRAFRACQGHLGHIEGRIEHSYHGEKSRRRYVERWDVLNRHKFDPTTDLHRNRWGVLELSNNKPEMRRELEAYHRQRMEDQNCRFDD